MRSFTAAVHARAKSGELEAAGTWISEMLKRGLLPNLACASSLIHAHSRSGDVKGADLRATEARFAGTTALLDGLRSNKRQPDFSEEERLAAVAEEGSPGSRHRAVIADLCQTRARGSSACWAALSLAAPTKCPLAG